ncbi:hypothetical protein A20C1_07778 [marine actinobacterium PHSC20C1]|nr:hypothetical protein A20C1_07778 [marine actinobacterium PHSC20C1]
MSANQSGADARRDGRDESVTERSDRNWTEILQELRVIQTGTQILTGFLLTLAFQPRFTELDQYQVVLYLTLVGAAVLATALALAPVSLHRALFGRKVKPQLVTTSDRLLKVTLVVVSLTLIGTAMLIFDVVVGRSAGITAGALAAVVAASLWVVLPAIARKFLSHD